VVVVIRVRAGDSLSAVVLGMNHTLIIYHAIIPRHNIHADVISATAAIGLKHTPFGRYFPAQCHTPCVPAPFILLLRLLFALFEFFAMLMLPTMPPLLMMSLLLSYA